MRTPSTLLLDTHVLIWWLSADTTLAPKAIRAIANRHATVFVSAASVWEMAIKSQLGKLKMPDDLQSMLEHHSLTPLPITAAHALHTKQLPLYHNDPFDRMLIAQAQQEQLTIITRDRQFAQYDIRLLEA